MKVYDANGVVKTNAAGSVTPSEFIYSDEYANQPNSDTEGALFFPTDGLSVQRDTGTVWQSWGPLYPLTTPPNIASWTWINEDNSTVAASKGGYTIARPGSGAATESVSALVTAAPTPPYTITIGFLFLHGTGGTSNMGFLWRESGSGKLQTFTTIARESETFVELYISSYNFNSTSSFNGTNFERALAINHNFIFFQVEDNNTNRFWRVSCDGINFSTLESDSRTDFLTPNQIGIYTNNYTVPIIQTMYMNVISWKQE